MVSKSIVAHELGHAIAAFSQDSGYIPTMIELVGSKGCYAACYMDEFKMDKPGPFGKVKAISDLGGIYGELIYQGWWNPWGARLDLDNFISANKKLTDLDAWFWTDIDEGSFRHFIANSTITERKSVKVDSHLTYRITPYIWEAYCDFCDRIDKDEFLVVVNELHKGKIATIEGEDISELGRRILL